MAFNNKEYDEYYKRTPTKFERKLNPLVFKIWGKICDLFNFSIRIQFRGQSLYLEIEYKIIRALR